MQADAPPQERPLVVAGLRQERERVVPLAEQVEVLPAAAAVQPRVVLLATARALLPVSRPRELALDSPRVSALPPVQVPVALVVPELVPRPVPLAAVAKPQAQA